MKAYHTGVFGSSGGGKTTLLREMQATFSGVSIFVDFTQNGTDNVPGVKVASIDDAVTAVGRTQAWDSVRLHWRLPPGDGAIRGGREIRRFAHRIAKKAKVPVQVIVDEAQNVLHEDIDEQNPYKSMLHEDRDMGIKVVVSTQDPQDLKYGPIKQCTRYVWVGEYSAFHEGFIRYFGIDRSELPTEPYKFVTLNRRMEPVERGETKEQYA